jgi:acyl carrier protein
MSIETDTVQPVRRFVVENFLFGRDEGLNEDESFMESGIVDSTGVLQLVAFLETTYEIKVDDEELVPENLDSIRSISAFLRSKLAR